MLKPSYLGLLLSGLLIFIAISLLITELNKNNSDITGLKLINLILFISSTVGIHSILHFMAEVKYNFNPLENYKLYY
jgi:hypothetical protein